MGHYLLLLLSGVDSSTVIRAETALVPVLAGSLAPAVSLGTNL